MTTTSPTGTRTVGLFANTQATSLAMPRATQVPRVRAPRPAAARMQRAQVLYRFAAVDCDETPGDGVTESNIGSGRGYGGHSSKPYES